jgi:hypothetical protein
MPVYICQAGSNSSEPWRHGLQVYAAPFQLTDLPSGDSRDGHGNACTLAPPMVSSTGVAGQTQDDNSNNNNNNYYYNNDPQTQRERRFRRELIYGANANDPNSNNNENNNDINREQQHIESLRFGLPVRRIRHAEVVLVDDVCIAHDRHCYNREVCDASCSLFCAFSFHVCTLQFFSIITMVSIMSSIEIL